MSIARTAALAASALIIASCKSHDASETTTPPAGAALSHLHPGPPLSGGEQTWHAHISQCSAEDKLLGSCGTPSSGTPRTPSFWRHSGSPFLSHRPAGVRRRSP